MRTLERNMRTVYYAVRTGETDINDDSGYPNGEVQPIYGTPVSVRVTIGDPTGSVVVNSYGREANTERLIISANINLPFDINTVFWIDDTDTTHEHDYEVAAPVAVGLNGLTVRVRKVR